jgi:hypothetical protein
METVASILVVSFLSVLVVDARNKRREFLRKRKI